MASIDAHPVPTISDLTVSDDNALPLASPVTSIGDLSEDEQAADSVPSRAIRNKTTAVNDQMEGYHEEDEEEYGADDVRCMSPKRSAADIERLSDDARRQLIEQARQLQASLMAIVDRVESVKEEHDKLEGGNKFLQQYIGELIQTSKITSTTGSKSKGKAGRK